jgi:hypothetical protein
MPQRETPSNIEKMNIPLKTVVAIVIYISSLVGVYYTMKFRIDDTEAKVTLLQNELNKYSPEVMDYRLNEVQVQVAKLNDKADKIYNEIIAKQK